MIYQYKKISKIRITIHLTLSMPMSGNVSEFDGRCLNCLRLKSLVFSASLLNKCKNMNREIHASAPADFGIYLKYCKYQFLFSLTELSNRPLPNPYANFMIAKMWLRPSPSILSIFLNFLIMTTLSLSLLSIKLNLQNLGLLFESSSTMPSINFCEGVIFFLFYRKFFRLNYPAGYNQL